MGHSISGIVGSLTDLEAISTKLDCDGYMNSSAAWGFLPLDDTDLDRAIPPPQDYFGGDFIYVSKQLVELIRGLSADHSIAYIETEYFGGVGSQSAFAFQRGEEVFPPTSSRDAINDALAAIGVDFTQTGLDEFESVGLHHFRSNEAAKDVIRKTRGQQGSDGKPDTVAS